MAIVSATVVVYLVRLLRNDLPEAIKNFWFLATYSILYSILSEKANDIYLVSQYIGWKIKLILTHCQLELKIKLPISERNSYSRRGNFVFFISPKIERAIALVVLKL